MRDPGSIPGGYLCETGISPVSIVLLYWWLQCDFDHWHHCPSVCASLGFAPTWWSWWHSSSSWFHACCRSSFQLHNRQSRLLGGSPVESLQSHFILTMSHWFSGLPVCFPSWGTLVQSPGGYLSETGILLLAMSCYKSLFGKYHLTFSFSVWPSL